MFKTFLSLTTYQTTILKSKFLCFGLKITSEEEAKIIIKEYKTKYKNASHLCYAYILGNKQETYYYTDGGEPNKTAGYPLYLALKSNHLSCCLLIVVRYFGGIKFGTKKLKDCFNFLANQTIKSKELVNAKLVNLYCLTTTHNEFKTLAYKYKNKIVKKEFAEKIKIYLGLDDNEVQTLANYPLKKNQSNYLLISSKK